MTKLYFNALDPASGILGTSTQSTALTETFAGPHARRGMDVTAGTTQTSSSFNSDAVTSASRSMVAKFCVTALTVSTIDANTWEFAIANNETNLNANSFTALSIYIVRGPEVTVRGYIYDSTTNLGSEWDTTEHGRVSSVSGSSVSGVISTDWLVVEVWRMATQGMATAYLQEIFYDGATDPANLIATTDAASYLSTPQDIFAAGAPALPPELIVARYGS